MSERQLVEGTFRRYGLPGWLGWGTYGAESSYGKNGEFLFGGIDLPSGNTRNLRLAARESARAYSRLIGQYGSVAAAVPHYSGGSYTVGHVLALAHGGSGQTPATPAEPHASSEPKESSGGPGGVSGDLMHFGLVLALVVGGAAMIGYGAQKFLGRPAKAAA